jgi:hypothetical protein
LRKVPRFLLANGRKHPAPAFHIGPAAGQARNGKHFAIVAEVGSNKRVMYET